MKPCAFTLRRQVDGETSKYLVTRKPICTENCQDSLDNRRWQRIQSPVRSYEPKSQETSLNCH